MLQDVSAPKAASGAQCSGSTGPSGPGNCITGAGLKGSGPRRRWIGGGMPSGRSSSGSTSGQSTGKGGCASLTASFTGRAGLRGGVQVLCSSIVAVVFAEVGGGSIEFVVEQLFGAAAFHMVRRDVGRFAAQGVAAGLGAFARA